MKGRALLFPWMAFPWVAFCCVALAVTDSRGAEPPRPLPHGWTLYPHRGISTRSAVACALELGVTRSWSGDVSVFDGSSWSALPAIPGNKRGQSYGDGLAVTLTGKDIFVEASGRIAHWDGSEWSMIELPGWRGPIGAMTVLKSGQLVVIGQGRIGLGSGDEIVSYDAGTWRDLTVVAGTALTDLWTAGQGGTVMHHGSGGWSRMTTGTAQWIRGLLVPSPTAGWAWGSATRLGGAAFVLRLDARGWSPASDGLSSAISGMAGPGDRPWAVSDSSIARYDGSRWVTEVEASDLGSDYQRFRGMCQTARFVFAGSLGRASGALVRKLGR